MISIDIVVPTAKTPSNIAPIADLAGAAGDSVKCYFVTDGPVGAVQNDNPSTIRIIRNAGSGAHSARNTGFDAGQGEYVLFLDDDVTPEPGLLRCYVEAIKEHPDSIGFVGSVDFPDPENSFERGVVSSDILTFFGIARTRNEFTWGVTANLMVKRAGVGSVRFSDIFPGHGGGEDIDFCLRVVESTGKKFLTLPAAVVSHPWWGRGRRQYRRFLRWAYGDSRLPELHQAYRYHNIPNMVESGVVGALVFLVLAPVHLGFAWDAAGSILIALFSESAVEAARAIKKGIGSVGTGVEAALVRLSNELGRFVGNIKRAHFGICERFDYFTTGESIPYERKVAAQKFAIFSVGLAILVLLVR